MEEYINFNDELKGGEILPPLEKEELYSYFKKMQSGDTEARRKIIEHSMALVLHQKNKYKKIYKHDVNDLVSIGIIGLIKSVDTFDLSKNYEFSTYAMNVIRNEMINFIKQENRRPSFLSLDYFVKNEGYSGDDEDRKIIDSLYDSSMDVCKIYEEMELSNTLREIINNLPERNKTVVVNYFGFRNDKRMTQYEIADLLGISQTAVMKIIKKELKNIYIQLKSLGMADEEFYEKPKQKIK